MIRRVLRIGAIHVVALVLMSDFMLAQDACDDDKGITTAPGQSTNSEKPSKRNSSPTIFDWRNEWFNMRIDNVITTSTTIQSPFFNPSNSHLADLRVLKDFRPEDGWELIKQEFGAPFDAEDDDFEHDLSSYPTFILYNRYTGILRVFVAVFQRGYSFADVQLMHDLHFSSGYPSTLDLAGSTSEEPLKALTGYVHPPDFRSIAQFANTNRDWLYADFPMMYDPCVCSYPSRMRVEAWLIDEANISLTGTTAGQIANIEDKDGDYEPEGSKFSLGLNNAVSATQKASQTYTSLANFKTSTLAKVDEYHTFQESQSEDFKDKIIAAKDAVAPALNVLETALSESSFLRTALKAVPYVGAAVDGILHFVAGGQKAEGPATVKMTPMAMHSTSSYNGTISHEHLYRQVLFYSPGSDFDIEDDDWYPYYNEPLGVFSMLSRPVADVYVHVGPPWNDGNYDSVKIRLQAIPEFAINYAAGFEPSATEIMASLSVEFDDMLVYGHATVNADPSVEVVSDRIVRTKYVPLGCITDLPLIFSRDRLPGPGLSGYPATTGKVYLKLLVRLQRLDATETTQNILWVGTYLVDEIEIEQQPESYWESSWYGFQNDLVISGASAPIVHTSSEYVWRKISIGPDVVITTDVSPDPPALVELVAGEEIVVTSEEGKDVVIEPNSILRIGMPVNCQVASPPVTLTRLNEFC